MGEADQLVTTLMGERGYPAEGYGQQKRDLSVEHPGTRQHYRIATRSTVAPETGTPQPRNCGAPWSTTAHTELGTRGGRDGRRGHAAARHHTFADHKRGLEGRWRRGEDIATEDLRKALQQYRSFFDRLLST
ncbi:hypothetical protein ACH4U7_22755 [Streptomyces sp. NPDC020845]|uniref:hypothetical protein n=1 Tax=Streptomyces sp. NPDC020845 TaxID=3365096 RepID=UPI003791311C